MTISADLPTCVPPWSLARRGLGTTWPNPSVGCVSSATAASLAAATPARGAPARRTRRPRDGGRTAKGATAYVTLEPCCHWGDSPPCTDALIAAGVARVVVAATDPDHRVNGQGPATQGRRHRGRNRAAGSGGLETLLGFNHRITLGRPMVTLKLASTLDGRIATQGGESQWITGTPGAPRRPRHARPARRGHGRRRHRARRQPRPDLPHPRLPPDANVRVIADSHLRTPLTSRLITTAADIPTWFLLREGTNLAREDAFVDLGAKLIKIPGSTGRC